MIDFLAFIIGFFLVCILIFIILVGVKFFYSIATVGQSNNIYNQETDKQLIEDSKEDSNGDGLLLFDDPLFPEELDDDDE
jgi:anionic cell wall polymer biosynthesis LytR-Cps2A-Psr (LCP) family protein